jgi:two-component system, NtrC family, sensor histidine kinase HydH
MAEMRGPAVVGLYRMGLPVLARSPAPVHLDWIYSANQARYFLTMAETLFDELKRYVAFGEKDQQALKKFSPLASPDFPRIIEIFYARILEHEGSRKALEGGESKVGQLKVSLAVWIDKLLKGPWDEDYFQLRCRIGRVHVRIALPQHYMFGAMSVLRGELNQTIDRSYTADSVEMRAARLALGKVLDLELAIMLHTYREDLLAQQSRSERLSTFGQLVGTIGHELRNPLGVIETSLYILQNRIGEDERNQKHIARMGEQLGVANNIITDLLEMIHDRPLTKERVILGALIERITANTKRAEGVQFVVSGFESLPAVSGDAGQLRQVFVNLIDNAVQAVSPKGTVRILAACENRLLRIAVEDTGPGVDVLIRRRLFEPLVTTKPNGIGLGLALVKRIVERHEGTVEYDSSTDGGARFVVQLPSMEGANA